MTEYDSRLAWLAAPNPAFIPSELDLGPPQPEPEGRLERSQGIPRVRYGQQPEPQSGPGLDRKWAREQDRKRDRGQAREQVRGLRPSIVPFCQRPRAPSEGHGGRPGAGLPRPGNSQLCWILLRA
jgi:hypothetical protein